MKLLGLCSGDPSDPRVYSGSARQLFRALDERGVLDGALDVDRTRAWQVWTHTRAVAETRHLRASRLLGRWTERAMRARSTRAARLLAQAPSAQAVLLYGTDFYPAPDGGRARVPVVATLDTTFAQLARAGEWKFGSLSPRETRACVERQRAVLERCTWIFPWTRWCADSLRDDYGIAESRMVLTGAGPNFDVGLDRDARRDGCTMLFVGRDWSRKNGPLVLDAFRLARVARPDLRLVVVGPREAPAREAGVEWLGPLDGSLRGKLGEMYATSALLLAPARFEPFGIALLEAMSAGIPVLALDRGAAREIVVDGVTGTLLSDPEPRALAEAALDWLSNRERLARAGEAARERVRTHFGWDRAARRIVETLSGANLPAHAAPPSPAGIAPHVTAGEGERSTRALRAARYAAGGGDSIPVRNTTASSADSTERA
ncbi:MAG: glycosyltransferase family 4 protein [Planctomycetota bacterium]